MEANEDIIKLIREDGSYQLAQKGGHREFKHDTKQGRVTIAGKPNDDLAPGTENGVLHRRDSRNKRCSDISSL